MEAKRNQILFVLKHVSGDEVEGGTNPFFQSFFAFAFFHYRYQQVNIVVLYIYLLFSVFFHNFPHFSRTQATRNHRSIVHFHSNLQTFLLPLFALFIMNWSLLRDDPAEFDFFYIIFFIGSRGNLKV